MPQRGVIVAVRTITTPSPSRAAAAPADPRGAVLRALAVSADAPPPPESAEYLVRRDDGRTVSVVQPLAAGLRRGEAVLLRGTGPMALSPAP